MTTNKAWIILVFLGILTVLSGLSTRGLQFNYNFEDFFPNNDQDLDYFLAHRDTFSNDNDFILFSIENNPSIFDSAFLHQIDQFTNQLKELPHVTSVVSPTQFKEPIINSFGTIQIPIMHITDKKKYATDSLRISKSPIAQNFFSPSFSAISIQVQHVNIITKKESDELNTALLELIDMQPFGEKLHYAGKVRGQEVYINTMKNEFFLFFIIAFLFVISLLIISLRSLPGIILPILTVLISITLVMGVIYLFGGSINVMTAILPTILFVVAMSDVIHFWTHYFDLLSDNIPKKEAIKKTIKKIGLATFLTSITTAIGFLTLLSIKIKPIQQFGIYTAIGVFIAFITTFLFLPAIFTLYSPKQTKIKKNWSHFLTRLFILTFRNGKKISIFLCLLLVVSIIGISQIKMEYFILSDLQDSNPLKKDFVHFDKYYAGVRPFEMGLHPQNEHSLFDYDFLQELNKITTYLENEMEVGNIISPLTIIKQLNKATHNGNSSNFQLPSTKKEYKKIQRKLKYVENSKQLKSIVNQTKTHGRLIGKLPDIGSLKMEERMLKFEEFLNTKINQNIIQCKITGTAHLLDKNNKYIAKDMLTGLSIACLFIALTMGIIYKSVKTAIITLITNCIPLILIGGIMGFTGTPINISTAIIFTIAFGIAVDDTIHFLSRYKIESEKLSNIYAIKKSYTSTGKAIIVTTIILSGGFLPLIFSSFKSTYYTGVYVSLMLLFAVVIDLTLLPLVLKKKK